MASKRYDLKVQMVRWVPATLKFTVGELWNRIPARFTNNLINIRHRIAGRPLHDQSAIFVLPSYFFATDNYYPVTVQAHGAWYHVQVPCPHQRNDTSRPVFICYVVTEIQGTSVYERESWRPEPNFSSTLTRQHARIEILLVLYITGNPSRKDHFPRITLPLTNQIAWFVTLHCDLSIPERSCSKRSWNEPTPCLPVDLNLCKLPWSRVYGAFDTTIGQSDCTICNTVIRQS